MRAARSRLLFASWLVLSGWAVAASSASSAACSRLPSATPLGAGPLAREVLEPLDPSLTEDRGALGDASARASTRSAGSDEAPQRARTTKDDDTRRASVEERGAKDGGGGDDDGGVVVFAGEYRGFDEATITFEGMPPLEQRDDKARTRVVEEEGGGLTLTLVASDTGDPICSLQAEREGASATVHPDQRCFDMDAATTGTVRAGTARIAGDTLYLDLEIELETERAGTKLSGSLDYHFEGERE